MPNPEDFKTDACRDFAAHWRTLRGNKAECPTVRDFLGVLNPGTQPYSMIIDVPDAESLKVRLFAAGLAEKAGIDVTNSNLQVFTSTPVIARNLSKACMAVSRQRCGMWSIKRAVTAGGREVAVESVSFPLTPGPNGPPAICTGIDIVERLSTHDTLFKIISYVSANWIDIGFGIPDIRLELEHAGP